MSAPPRPDASALVFRSRLGQHLFLTDRSRVYDLPADTEGIEAARSLASSVNGQAAPRNMQAGGMPPPPVRSLSLNLAQACNMACGYCYADEGRFGGQARSMPLDIALASVDQLINQSHPGDDLVLGFIGGEPLLNRRVLHAVTTYAAAAALRCGRRMRFSLTTNATLITPEDAALLHQHGFHVSVSLDGASALNDLLRPMRDGSGSHQRVLDGLAVLNAHGRPRHLAARVTVTPRTGELLPILEHHINLGFDSVGFAAVLTSPDPELAFQPADFEAFTHEMISCGRHALSALSAGRHFPFGNFETALQEIHRGSHRPYPCGAGAGYLSVGASGKLYACHRVIDEAPWQMGDVHAGVDDDRRSEHLRQRHVDRQEPCRSCWARYLCGGGCYHEVERRGRLACDYIRAWLEFCLGAYAELSDARPDYFGRSQGQSAADRGLTANTVAG